MSPAWCAGSHTTRTPTGPLRGRISQPAAAGWCGNVPDIYRAVVERRYGTHWHRFLLTRPRSPVDRGPRHHPEHFHLFGVTRTDSPETAWRLCRADSHDWERVDQQAEQDALLRDRRNLEFLRRFLQNAGPEHRLPLMDLVRHLNALSVGSTQSKVRDGDVKRLVACPTAFAFPTCG